MQKLISVVALLLCATFSASALAETEEQTAQQIYNKIKYIKSLPSLAPWLQSDVNFNDSLKITKARSDERYQLEKLLETKASRGETDAIFYTAMMKSDEASFLRFVGNEQNNINTIKESTDKYDLALQLFKQAGDAGISEAYWNVAVIYANGYGSTSSKLAAIEWYYKAGIGYLKAGDREQALAALEAIQAIRLDSELGKRLEKQLNKGAPK